MVWIFYKNTWITLAVLVVRVIRNLILGVERRREFFQMRVTTVGECPGIMIEDDDFIFDVVYYESRKRELKRRLINECRGEERLKTKPEESTRLTYTGRLVPRKKM
jgi:hypothetical protein